MVDPDVIRFERRALIDTLETLTPDQWRTPSLCAGWTVQDVAAHLAFTPSLSVGAALAELARSGCRVNRMIADTGKRWSARGPEVILAQLRSVADRGATPPVPALAVLVDAVMHGVDVRRPLGLTRPVPAEAFAPVARYFLSARGPLALTVGGSLGDRVRGVRLAADDVDWSHGEGPEVRGTAEALLLLLGRRPVGPGDLHGPGAAEVYARLAR